METFSILIPIKDLHLLKEYSKMAIRRQCDPLIVQSIWNAIKCCGQSKQTTDTTKIAKYLQKDQACTAAEAEAFIKQCVEDKLITLTRRSDAIVTYRLPKQDNPESDGKDWYCFECHLAGEVIPCLTCFRVFHKDCLGKAKRRFETVQSIINGIVEEKDASDSPMFTASGDKKPKDLPGTNRASGSGSYSEKKSDKSYRELLCLPCNINVIDESSALGKDEINYILRFVLVRIRSWVPENITQKIAEEDKLQFLTDTDLTWRANQLFFEHIDMSTINVKLNTETYNNFSEFLTDVYTIQHNVTIFHGADSQEYDATELAVKDTLHDLTEIKNCVDCYRNSNEKINNRWFCLPCRKSHEVVWAKQKGYPYWPAKVMKESETHYDVRFFGGKYERALLERRLVKPISTPKQELQLKVSIGFTKACEEMKLYQSLLDKPGEVEKLKATPNKPRRSIVRRKSGTQLNRSQDDESNMSNASLNASAVSSEATPKRESNSKAAGKRKSSSVKATKKSPDKKRKSLDEPGASTPMISGNVIDISDGEDVAEYSFEEQEVQERFINLDESYGLVSSSTENCGRSLSPRREQEMQPLDQIYSDAVEKMRRKLECLSDKNEIVKCAMDCMQAELDIVVSTHTDYIKKMYEQHLQQISETKKKQWCFNCEQDAIYHCCWNTAYCSTACQQQHWQAEHKKVCRRKR